VVIPIGIDLTISPQPKQIEFFLASSKYVAYGGARGGGKSWALRTKAVILALKYSGIKILIIRRTLKDLRANHELPLMEFLNVKDKPNAVARYDSHNKEFHFPNKSMIKLGYCDSEGDVLQYQGQSYDVVCLEEATQFTEFMFMKLQMANRRSDTLLEPFVSRMYLTCNPGGVGHAWVKRLFIDRQYKELENPDDYTFISAKVYDNEWIVKNDPKYIEMLEALPEEERKAMLDGSWDVYEGQFFPEFDREIHVVKPFDIPRHWKRYRSLDYGMDMTACYWYAVDEDGNIYVYKELHEPNLILKQAAQRIVEMTDSDEFIISTYASPDLWNRRQETGESGYETMAQQGLFGLVSANNKRIEGWRQVREVLAKRTDRYGNQTPRLRIFQNCTELIKNMPLLRYDPKKPEDAASTPHEVTHAPESLRYFCASSRVSPTYVEQAFVPQPFSDNDYGGVSFYD
jgi:phage terminase large subunit